MKSTLLLYILMFAQALTWSSYEDKEVSISIKFPSSPFTKEKIIRTDLGETMVKTVYWAAPVDSTENYLYLLNYYKLDEIIFFGDTAISKKEYLNEALNNIKKELNAQLLYSNEKTDKGCPVLVYRFELDQDKVMKGKLVLSNGYFYSLQVFSTKNYSLNKNMDKFLNSFVHRECD